MRATIVRGGCIVTLRGVSKGDILIRGERIERVGPKIEEVGARLIPAEGLYVLPGLIDAHCHLRDPGLTHKEDFYTGTCAALAGGVTTVLDMPNTSPPATSREALARKGEIARQKAVADYGFFLGASGENVEYASQVEGAIGLKVFLGSSTGPLLVDDFPSLYHHFQSWPQGRPIAVHAEDEEAIQFFSALHPAGPHSQARPPICAALAVARALALAESSRARLHICHLSTRWELEMVIAAKKRGLVVSCEVTPHHLFLDESAEAELGSLVKVNPPLRSQDEVEWLWEHLSEIDIVASDHAPHTLAEKEGPNPPSGVPGLETMLPLLLTAVLEGRIRWEELARLTAAGPERLYGLERKGHIAPGYDADLVLVSTEGERTLGERLYSKCGWTPFAGRKVKGSIVCVFLRGEEAFREGEILVQPGFGRPAGFRP